MRRRIMSVAAGVLATGALAGGGALAYGATATPTPTPTPKQAPPAGSAAPRGHDGNPCPNMGGDGSSSGASQAPAGAPDGSV